MLNNLSLHQPQLPQSFLIGEVLHPPDHFGGPFCYALQKCSDFTEHEINNQTGCTASCKIRLFQLQKMVHGFLHDIMATYKAFYTTPFY